MEEKKNDMKAMDKDVDEVNTDASGGYQTPIQEDIRQTGTQVQTNAKDSAKPEAGGPVTPGTPNQGTESR